jgi:hypothetical protein
VDWDGIGTAALFLSSGVISVGVITLRAYAMRLQHRLELERLQHSGRDDSELAETLVTMQDQMVRLNERLDFNERLLSSKESEER